MCFPFWYSFWVFVSGIKEIFLQIENVSHPCVVFYGRSKFNVFYLFWISLGITSYEIKYKKRKRYGHTIKRHVTPSNFNMVPLNQ